ncbi:MAG: hypothetical protein DKT66_05060 [Candidatus Melainabacteria bacterium]|nr:MAG: hypothetical protein DKT66_05060 [Candidatus Melainabacteria bacterium]
MLMPPIATHSAQFVERDEKPRTDSSHLASASNNDAFSNDKGNETSSNANDRITEAGSQSGKGGLNAFDLLNDSAKLFKKGGELLGFGLAPSADVLPQSDVSKMTPEQKGARGYQNAESHENQYMKLKEPYQQKTFDEAGLRAPKDASVSLNDKGQITGFTTSPAPGKAEGASYKNIKYDEGGAVKSFETPWGTTISRVGDADKNGYGKWQQTNSKGQLVNYQGADAAQWYGKSVVDENGMHNIVASPGAKQWNMYSRSFDGTYTETNPSVEKGVLKGFETTTTLADNTKISSKSHFEKGDIVRNTSVDLFGAKGEKNSVEMDESKKSGKFVSSDELKKREALASMMDFDKNPMFDNVNSMKLNRRGNNLDFSADLDKAVSMPPPNVRVYGVGGFKRASAVPISSQVDDPSGTIVTHPENPGRVDIVNMHGFTGAAQAYGPLGRPRGVHASSTDSMTMYSDQRGNGHVIARSDQASVDLTAQHMRGGMFGDMLANPAKKQQFTDGLAKLRDNLDSLEFKKDAKGDLHGSFDPRASEIPINKNIAPGLDATKLYFNDGKLNFDVHKIPNGKELSFKEGDLKVGVNVPVLGETKLSVSKVVTTKDAQGKPHIEVEFHGKPGRTKVF